ncbi:MAG TPA: response regulator [Casimicrobiaceae bacterium]|nr:response regulator [Casimicrobiaceae bacterium]
MPDVPAASRPKILIVDDEPYNVDFLEQELDDLGYDTVSAFDGGQALAQVRAQAPDLLLLDIMMPVMDGFAVLERLKSDTTTRDIPVVIISAVNDLSSIVKGIQLGADDYLPKPFEPVILQARIRSGLDRKLRRDLEIEYLRQVERLTAAAESVQASAYDESAIAPVAARGDALGNLARVFRKMAKEVVAREQRLRQQLRQLQLDIEEQRSNAADTTTSYVPMDRRQALARGTQLPQRMQGTALFADISGFTPLTESFARELGLQRGAEEVTRQVNRVHAALIACVHRYQGSVVGFGGDAITCWFDADPGLRAVACGLAIQAAMREFADIVAPGGLVISLGVKVAVAGGTARRMLVGDPRVQLLDVLGGRMFDELAVAEHHAMRGDVIVTDAVATALRDHAHIGDWRDDLRFAVVEALAAPVPTAPWPDIAPDAIGDEHASAFLPPAVRDKVRAGQSAFLSELRPAAALFLRFEGIDYDDDANAERKLDRFTRWVQTVAQRHDGALLQLTLGDKGSSFYLTFGAPVAHYDDATRAIRAALELQTPPAELDYIGCVAIGVAHGPVRAAAYGSAAHRAYSVIGDKANLAARLMMQAPEHGTLCDEAVHAAAREHVAFDALAPVLVKGKSLPVAVYRPRAERAHEPERDGVDRAALVDRLSPAEQLTLKTASVIGHVFAHATLQAVYPDDGERQNVASHLDALVALEFIAPLADGGERVYAFAEPGTREAAYARMLFAQRRQLHRDVAQWYEHAYAADPAPHYATLARHWRAADEPAKAIHYLEKAGEIARLNGAYEEAQRYFTESLAIDRRGSVLSSDYAD